MSVITSHSLRPRASRTMPGSTNAGNVFAATASPYHSPADRFLFRRSRTANNSSASATRVEAPVEGAVV